MRRKSDLSRNANTVAKKYRDDILSGKITAVKVPPKTLRQFKKLGYESSKGRLLIGHAENEKAVFSRGEVKILNPHGVERVQVPVAYHNLDQYFKDIKKNAKQINRLKTGKEFFGFRFFGHNSTIYSRDIELLIDELTKYRAVLGASGSRKKQLEIFKNLEIVRFTKIKEWEQRTRQARQVTRQKQAKQKREYRKKMRKPQRDSEREAHRKR
jgi:hypothetical protein